MLSQIIDLISNWRKRHGVQLKALGHFLHRSSADAADQVQGGNGIASKIGQIFVEKCRSCLSYAIHKHCNLSIKTKTYGII